MLPETIAMTFYRLSTKLRKGNVFSRVCLSVSLTKGSPHVTITHDTLDLTTQGPPASPTTYSNLFDLDTSLYSPFTPSQACSNFFNLDFTVPGPFGPALDPPVYNSSPPPSQYSCQVGGLHPTAMFSFVCLFFLLFLGY